MGMDFNIYSAPNHAIFNDEKWYESDKVEEKFYARKAWHFPENCKFIPHDYENGDFIRISKENLEEMIKVACEHRNYWGNYDDVPRLCELRDEFDELEEQGKHLYLEYDW